MSALDSTRIRGLAKRAGRLASRRLRKIICGSETREVPIFFVIGRGRSGTNWLMRTLNMHPEVLCLGEGRFFGRNLRRENRKSMQTTDHIKHKVQPTSLYNALADSEYLRLWLERSVWTRDGDTEEQLLSLTRAAIYHFLTRRLEKTGKRIVGDKTPLAGTDDIVGEMAAIFPEARVIHIIRDGRDQLISQAHFRWNRAVDMGGPYKVDEEDLEKRDRYRQDPEAFLESGESIFSEKFLRRHSRVWKENVEAARRSGALFGDRYTEVYYEDLLRRPEQEFARLFDFLGADAQEKLVARCVEATAFEKRSGGRERGQEDTFSAARKGVAGDWKATFTERDRQVFKEVAGDLLVELGYENDGNW